MSTREVKKAIRKEMQWITPRRGRYDNIASELESAQQHLDTALRYMTSKKGDSAVKKQFFDSVRSINETAQKCLALIAVENSHASE